MNVSVNWLRELAPDIEGDPREIARRFSMVAAAVEDIEPVGAELDDVVVGRVADVRPHPNADRLSLCSVDAGREAAIDVVCGAPVIVEGARYPYVPAGATLPGGFRIEEREIRGEVSHGMLCSELELGIGRDKSGIMRLGDGATPGTPIADVLDLPDTRLSLDLNPNRVDLACHVGVARELAADGRRLALRDFGATWSPSWLDGDEAVEGAGIRVTIESLDRCPRYLAAVIRGVSVGPSPAWLAGRLLAAGARPINNIVDATNYVLLERNQPLHAFDLSTLSGAEIRVRAAREGETLQTLDGERHELTNDATVIADRERPVALAGVMGGLDSEVTDRTTDVLIECAAFEPLSVRRTARSTGLATDASYRFERGIDVYAQSAALARAVELIQSIAGGEAEIAALRAGPAPEPFPDVPLRPSRVTQVLGIDLDAGAIDELLAPIGFERGRENDGPAFSVPGWRTDVTREIDLVEEVARRFGFDSFPDEERRFRPGTVPEDPVFERTARVRRLCTRYGLMEARSLTFMPRDHRGNLSEVAVPNPLSEAESFLRAGLVPVLLRRLEHNFARGRRDVRLFEVGTVFATGDGPPREGHDAGLERFREERRVGALITGATAPPHFSREEDDLGIWDLKGLAEEIAGRLLAGSIEPAADGEDPRLDRLGAAWLGAERLRLVADGRTVGAAGSVRAASIDAPPWAGPVLALEFDLDAVRPRPIAPYEALSPYPAVRRDLAISVPVSVPAGKIEAAIRDTASDLLRSLNLFDVYEGDEIGEDRRSLAWAFRFRADDRTLTDDEVEREVAALAGVLEERFDARIRTS